MTEKKGAKKWLVLLVILVALSLVVDLFSLNVLYGISNPASSTSSAKGELATELYPGYDYPYLTNFEDCCDGADSGRDNCLAGTTRDAPKWMGMTMGEYIEYCFDSWVTAMEECEEKYPGWGKCVN